MLNVYRLTSTGNNIHTLSTMWQYCMARLCCRFFSLLIFFFLSFYIWTSFKHKHKVATKRCGLCHQCGGGGSLCVFGTQIDAWIFDTHTMILRHSQCAKWRLINTYLAHRHMHPMSYHSKRVPLYEFFALSPQFCWFSHVSYFSLFHLFFWTYELILRCKKPFSTQKN